MRKGTQNKDKTKNRRERVFISCGSALQAGFISDVLTGRLGRRPRTWGSILTSANLTATSSFPRTPFGVSGSLGQDIICSLEDAYSMITPSTVRNPKQAILADQPHLRVYQSQATRRHIDTGAKARSIHYQCRSGSCWLGTCLRNEVALPEARCKLATS